MPRTCWSVTKTCSAMGQEVNLYKSFSMALNEQEINIKYPLVCNGIRKAKGFLIPLNKEEKSHQHSLGQLLYMAEKFLFWFFVYQNTSKTKTWKGNLAQNKKGLIFKVTSNICFHFQYSLFNLYSPSLP